jgi:uncharacterized DUF497 family protein
MDYEWDPDKALSNVHKHHVDFADAVLVFNDPLALTILDDQPSEERFVTLGMDGLGRILILLANPGSVLDGLWKVSRHRRGFRIRRQYQDTCKWC